MRILLLLLSLLLLPQLGWTQSSSRPIYFDVALDKYLTGDIDRAIMELEIGMEIEETVPERAKIFLTKLLVEAAVKAYLANDLDKFAAYLTKAKNLVPQDPLLNQIISWSLKKEETKVIEVPPAPPAMVKEPSDHPEEKKEETPPVSTPVSAPVKEVKYDTNILEQLAVFQTQQENILKNYLKDRQNYSQVVNKFNQDRTNLMSYLMTKQRTEQQSWQKILFSHTLIYSFITLIIISTVSLFVGKFILRRESVLVRAVAQQPMSPPRTVLAPAGPEIARPGLTGKIDDTAGIVTEQIVDKTIRDKIHGIEVIETEMKDQPEITERLLENFLTDTDSRIRSRAAQSLYPFNEDRAFGILWEIAHHPVAGDRINVVKIIEQIESPRTVMLLLKLVNDTDTNVKQQVFNTVNRILERQPKWLPDELKDRINQVVKKIKVNEGWIG